ncbi:MAG: oxysterol-binding protein [archaeon]|nr:oxysterol-binding protein [archaeon]
MLSEKEEQQIEKERPTKDPMDNMEYKNFMKKDYEKGLISNPELCETNKNNYLYSNTDFHPFSFLTGHHKWGYDYYRKYLTSPSPTLLTKEEWTLKPDLSKAGILGGFLIDDCRGLVLVDPFIKKKFSGLLKDLFSALLTVAMGKKVSLKVKLFEPKSVLHRITDYWSLLPKLITPTYSNTMTPLERMKNIMAFAVGGLYIPTKQLKPFNPLICETFEGEFQDDIYGTKIYAEQISNYPTVSRFYAINSELKLHGYVDLSVKTESFGTKCNFNTKGHVNLEYIKLGEKITYIFPTIKMLKLTSEEGRSSYWQNCLVIIDLKNNLKGVVRLGKNPKVIHEVEGYIIEFPFPKDYKLDYNTEQNFGNNYKITDQTYKVLATCSGSWLEKLTFDDKKYWDIDRDIPSWIRPVDYPLPSDGRYREDIIWLYRAFYTFKDENERLMYEGLAQNWKLMVEKLQREEREMKARKNSKRRFFGWI